MKVAVVLAPLAVLAALASGCDEGSAASPTYEANEGGAVDATASDAGASDAAEEPTYAVCPDGIDASFGSIYTLLLSTPSISSGCGTGDPQTCHSTKGSAAAGSGLDFSLEAGAVYVELLGPDGGGQRSTDEDYPDADILRVAPGDAGASMLYVKLTIDSGNEFPYGSGMPLNTPGSVCPATLAAVAAWINAGAPKN